MLSRYYTIRAYEKIEKFFIRGKILPMEDVKMYISAGKIYNTIIKTKKKIKKLLCIRSLEQGI
jgi:hypothetical protein